MQALQAHQTPESHKGKAAVGFMAQIQAAAATLLGHDTPGQTSVEANGRKDPDLPLEVNEGKSAFPQGRHRLQSSPGDLGEALYDSQVKEALSGAIQSRYAKTGWLHKKGGLNKAYKRRFFALDPLAGVLAWYTCRDRLSGDCLVLLQVEAMKR